MLYNKNNLVISDIINEKSSKPGLLNVLFQDNKTVATDSFILLEITNPVTMDVNEDFPVMGEECATGKLIKTVPAKTIKKVLQNIPKDKDNPIINHTIFLKSDENSARMATTNLENNLIVVSRTGEEFPDYGRIIPVDQGFTSIDIDAEFLHKLISTIKKMDLTIDNRITLSIKDDKTPAKITGKTVQGQDILGLIMPIR